MINLTSFSYICIINENFIHMYHLNNIKIISIVTCHLTCHLINYIIKKKKLVISIVSSSLSTFEKNA